MHRKVGTKQRSYQEFTGNIALVLLFTVRNRMFKCYLVIFGNIFLVYNNICLCHLSIFTAFKLNDVFLYLKR